MTEKLFLEDAYFREAPGRVTALTEEGGIVLDATIFYATGGGQPGDSGTLTWADGEMEVATAVKGAGQDIVLLPAEPTRMPPVGTPLIQRLHWERRHKLMRMHTALHLLSAVIPFPVTGGSVGEGRGRLDFAMEGPLEDKDAVEAALNEVIARDLAVYTEWVDDTVLDARPDLVKTLRVAPPRGHGRVRLVRIGAGASPVDLQPCGGTHVEKTHEIGIVRIGKVEKKGRENRRIGLVLEG